MSKKVGCAARTSRVAPVSRRLVTGNQTHEAGWKPALQVAPR
ncbi:MAG: hypothetical protein Q8O33_09025 [Pseudomonadota bacterium]|nr:hypothetical protein [Pseudomonadota bacterium]